MLLGGGLAQGTPIMRRAGVKVMPWNLFQEVHEVLNGPVFLEDLVGQCVPTLSTPTLTDFRGLILTYVAVEETLGLPFHTTNQTLVLTEWITSIHITWRSKLFAVLLVVGCANGHQKVLSLLGTWSCGCATGTMIFKGGKGVVQLLSSL